MSICYSAKLDLRKVHTNDVFNINICDILVSIKIDTILGCAVVATCSLGNFKQQLVISIDNVKLQLVIINNILYFIVHDKPILLSEINFDKFDITSGLEFVPDECLITDLLLSLDTKINVINIEDN